MASSSNFGPFLKNVSVDAVIQTLKCAGCKIPKRDFLQRVLHGKERICAQNGGAMKDPNESVCIVCTAPVGKSTCQDGLHYESDEGNKSYFQSEEQKIRALCTVLKVKYAGVEAGKLSAGISFCERCEIELTAIVVLNKFGRDFQRQNGKYFGRFKSLFARSQRQLRGRKGYYCRNKVVSSIWKQAHANRKQDKLQKAKVIVTGKIRRSSKGLHLGVAKTAKKGKSLRQAVDNSKGGDPILNFNDPSGNIVQEELKWENGDASEIAVVVTESEDPTEVFVTLEAKPSLTVAKGKAKGRNETGRGIIDASGERHREDSTIWDDQSSKDFDMKTGNQPVAQLESEENGSKGTGLEDQKPKSDAQARKSKYVKTKAKGEMRPSTSKDKQMTTKVKGLSPKPKVAALENNEKDEASTSKDVNPRSSGPQVEPIIIRYPIPMSPPWEPPVASTSSAALATAATPPLRKSDRLRSAPFYYSCHTPMPTIPTKKPDKVIKVGNVKVKLDATKLGKHGAQDMASISAQMCKAAELVVERKLQVPSVVPEKPAKSSMPIDDDEYYDNLLSEIRANADNDKSDFEVASEEYQCTLCKELLWKHDAICIKELSEQARELHMSKISELFTLDKLEKGDIDENINFVTGETTTKEGPNKDKKKLTTPKRGKGRRRKVGGYKRPCKKSKLEKDSKTEKSDQLNEEEKPPIKLEMKTDIFGNLVVQNNSRRSRRAKVPCPQCSKYVPSWLMRGHIQFYHNNLNRKCICKICTQRFITESQLTRHYLQRHKRALTRYKCTHPECNKGFPDEDSLKAHEEEHSTEGLQMKRRANPDGTTRQLKDKQVNNKSKKRADGKKTNEEESMKGPEQQPEGLEKDPTAAAKGRTGTKAGKTSAPAKRRRGRMTKGKAAKKSPCKGKAKAILGKGKK